jgi:hypothetical protein
MPGVASCGTMQPPLLIVNLSRLIRSPEIQNPPSAE